ncbi:MAG: DNA helicase RecQ [Gammaproteobacteria bacterium]|nr:DNA helicase RecQ [Gammaproteobacteria bacterium]
MNTISAETLHNTLKQHFGFDSFRPDQQAIIEYVLKGNDAFVVMPTGGGKSICYQLPALLLPGITVVISPLIALMKDQVDALTQNGIGAGFFNSQQTGEQRQQLRQLLNSNALKLIYTAPESLNGLLSIINPASISLIAIDEAHCISSWGHDFRPAYTQLSHLKSRLHCPFIALTATADKTTRADISAQLNIQHAPLFLSSFNRKNLSLDVASGQNRLPQILAFLRRHPNESGIIYCLSRKATESIAEKLRDNGHKAIAYHAGLHTEERESVQNRFINDNVNIICATIAFGMGIDKSNVRWVVHYNLPKNIEGYYQEIGRAGRDGMPAETLLFYSYGDVIQLRKFAESTNVEQEKIQLAKLERIQQYAESLTCRRKILLSYFGEHLDEDCGNCDICLHPPERIDGTVIAQKALSAIARLKQSEPQKVVIDLLRGAQNNYMLHNNYHQLKTHGAGKDITWQDWQQYLIQLINQGFIEIAYHDHHKLKLTEAAKTVLFDGTVVTLAKIVDAKERLKQQEKIHHAPSEPMFEMLRELRKSIAETKNIPAFTIFSDATLRDMMLVRPRNEEEFLSVSGVGQTKLEHYGQRCINAIKDYLTKNPEENKARPQRTNAVKVKPSRTSTVDESFALYEKGLSPKDIAEQRQLSEQTIMTHLCKAYQLGKSVDLHAFISPNELTQVKQAAVELDSPPALKPYFEHFNGKVSYDVIKICLFILENESE